MAGFFILYFAAALLGWFFDLGLFNTPRSARVEADFDQKKIDYRREEKEEDRRLHSIAWDVKTRQPEEIIYEEVV